MGGTFANLKTPREYESAEAPNYILSITAKWFTREGYTFEGFSTSFNSKTVKYKPGSDGKITFKVNSDMTVYCVWKPVTYTITCKRKRSSSISEVVKSVKANFGTYIVENKDLPKPAAGYSRTWYYEKDNERVVMCNSRVTGDVSIYYEDKPIRAYIQFYYGNTKLATKGINTNQTIGNVYSAPNRAGHYFIGWSPYKNGLDPSGSGHLVVYSPDYNWLAKSAGETVTLYAQYLSNGSSTYVDYITSKSELEKLYDTQKTLYTRTKKLMEQNAEVQNDFDNGAGNILYTLLCEIDGFSTWMAILGVDVKQYKDFDHAKDYFNVSKEKTRMDALKAKLDTLNNKNLHEIKVYTRCYMNNGSYYRVFLDN